MTNTRRYVSRKVAREAASASAKESGVCPICGRKKVPMEFDHKQPVSRLGRNTAENLWLICSACNRRKGDRTLFEFIRDEFNSLSLNEVREKASAIVNSGVDLDG